MKQSLIIALMVPALVGCAPMSEAGATPSAGGKACNAAKVQSFIGKPYDDALRVKMQKASRAKTIRVLAPDSMATRDYRIDRLNIHIDTGKVVTGADCG